MLVVGYGNPLRGDDGICRATAQALSYRRPDLAVQVSRR